MNDKIFLPITLVACALLFVVWYQFLYETAQREILSMELETRRLREIEREISELKSRHGDFATFVEAKELQLDEARNFLPKTPAQDEFIDELYRAADFCGAKIISVQASEINRGEEIQSQVVNIRLEAEYISLLNFIREAFDCGRLTSLEKFVVESKDDEILSCELSFKIFAESSSP